jgi:hypothetical protein
LLATVVNVIVEFTDSTHLARMRFESEASTYG